MEGNSKVVQAFLNLLNLCFLYYNDNNSNTNTSNTATNPNNTLAKVVQSLIDDKNLVPA